jgi:hypothetical protein
VRVIPSKANDARVGIGKYYIVARARASSLKEGPVNRHLGQRLYGCSGRGPNPSDWLRVAVWLRSALARVSEVETARHNHGKFHQRNDTAIRKET